MVSMVGFNCRSPSSTSRRAAHGPVKSSDIVNIFLMTSDGRCDAIFDFGGGFCSGGGGDGGE